MRRAAGVWERLFFRPSGPLGPAAVRAVVALNALWIILSRPDLPGVLAWPAPFWTLADPSLRLRFLVLGLPDGAERLLYAVLVAALVAAALGIRSRVACAVAAPLLYHFAPLEELVAGTRALWFRGLTLPVLALFVLAFARPGRRGDGPSAENRWPVALVRVLVAATFFASLAAKLIQSGPGWFSAGNVRDFALYAATFDAPPPLAGWLAGSPTACAAAAAATFVLELLFPLAAVSRRAAVVLVPAALVGHVGIALALGIVFLSAPLLAVFVDWDAVEGRLRACE